MNERAFIRPRSRRAVVKPVYTRARVYDFYDRWLHDYTQASYAGARVSVRTHTRIVWPVALPARERARRQIGLQSIVEMHTVVLCKRLIIAYIYTSMHAPSFGSSPSSRVAVSQTAAITATSRRPFFLFYSLRLLCNSTLSAISACSSLQALFPLLRR